MSSRAKQVAHDPSGTDAALPDGKNAKQAAPKKKKTAASLVAAAAASSAGGSPVPAAKRAANKTTMAPVLAKKAAAKKPKPTVAAPEPSVAGSESVVESVAPSAGAEEDPMDIAPEEQSEASAAVPAPPNKTKKAATAGKKVRAAAPPRAKKAGGVIPGKRVIGVRADGKRRVSKPGTAEARRIRREGKPKNLETTAICPASFEHFIRLSLKRINPKLSIYTSAVRKLHSSTENKFYHYGLHARDIVILSNKRTLWPEHLNLSWRNVAELN